MNDDPRRDLDALIYALERHLEVALSLDNEDDDSDVLIDAENRLRDAFFTYDDTLFTQTGVELPFDILDDEDEGDDDAGDSEDDDFDSDYHRRDDDDDSHYLDGEDFDDFDLTED
ncbi:DNA primase [Mobiluncus mulieris]|uniref:DNA primase n=1 Tax=Mobiluncus mulieris TaxID=2052 RepID=A0ABD4U0Q2_9ACTO|nr:DNA primase [Mobiluncus mulieris]MCU9969403.1 DNA primase [Mobiluncus mulieris]MCU9973841.1 DNA primase [Mobiluncus mulieris]MCV0009187.1 DNA primase [Mobiluncus mulieris]MCV0010788.1 DNA primase [Mobiluncus mulieris]NMX00247.1 DNA primase [Mobiluncus mulieris]